MTERRLVESMLLSVEIYIKFLLSLRADENTFYRPNGPAADPVVYLRESSHSQVIDASHEPDLAQSAQQPAEGTDT
jgi:hypothetical protein